MRKLRRPLISTFVSCQFFVYPCFVFSCLFLLVLFIFLKTKTPKIFLLFLFALLSLIRVVVLFLFLHFELQFYFVFLIFELQFKNPKIFSFLFVSSLLCFKNRKNQKYLLFLLVLYSSFQIRHLSVTSPGAWFSFHIIQVMQVKGNNEDI